MPRIPWALAAALVTSAVLATPASALYIQTPLVLSGPEHADVGDDVPLDITPGNASAKHQFAGKTVRVVYVFDANESNDPDGAVSSDGTQERFLADIVLDEEARATLTWTVPAEVDDHNVDLVVVSGDERVAFAFLAVGDAPAQMRIAASGPGGEPGPQESDGEQAIAEDAPGLGFFATLAAVGAVLALRRK